MMNNTSNLKPEIKVDSPPPTLKTWMEYYGLVAVGQSLVHEAKPTHAVGMDEGLSSDKPLSRFKAVADPRPAEPKEKLDWWSKKERVEDDPEHYL